MDSPVGFSDEVLSNASIRRQQDSNEKQQSKFFSHQNTNRTGGFSMKVESMKANSSDDHDKDDDSQDESFDSDKNCGQEDQETPKERSGSTPKVLDIEKMSKGREQRKSSVDHSSPRVAKLPIGVAYSENFSPDHILIKPRSIIKASKFKTPSITLNFAPPEQRMVSLKTNEGLPSSLFEDSDNKFLAVKKWKNEMKEVKEVDSPKSLSKISTGAKSVKFRLSHDEEKHLEQKEKLPSKRLIDNSSPLSADKTCTNKGNILLPG